MLGRDAILKILKGQQQSLNILKSLVNNQNAPPSKRSILKSYFSPLFQGRVLAVITQGFNKQQRQNKQHKPQMNANTQQDIKKELDAIANRD